jgi:hypothetical protein
MYNLSNYSRSEYLVHDIVRSSHVTRINDIRRKSTSPTHVRLCILVSDPLRGGERK